MLGMVPFCESVQGFELLTITMRAAELNVEQAELTVGDVCEIEGGTAIQRKQIKSLDLDLLKDGAAAVISSQQVAMRIALSGVRRTDMQLSGPSSTKVRLVKFEKVQPRIEAKLASEVSSQFGIPIDDVRVRLLSKDLLEQLGKVIDTSDFETSAFFSSKLPLGEQVVQVEFMDSKGNRSLQKIKLQIIVMHKVMVTSSNVARGTVITASHVQEIKRPLIDNKVELAGADCVGCVASRDIPPHEVVTTRHFNRTPQRKQVLVKRNDLVDIVLIQGPLRVRLKNAKAMTNGAKGEMIRVLNTNSNKELNAVVRDRTTVEVTN